MKGLIDSTLREGSQTFGLSFSPTLKKEIFAGLCRVGIEEVEIGVATPLDDDLPELIRFCRSHDSSRRLALWSRCRSDDIRFGATLMPDVLSLSIPVSDLHLGKKLGRDRAWALAAAESSILAARNLGIRVISLGLEDATRADRIFLEKMVQTAIGAGVDRLRLADTVGIGAPLEIAGLVKDIKGAGPVEAGVHMHNDFGLATANSLAALEAGADWADVTVLGLGERAGNARLEELAGYLALRNSRGYRLDSVVDLAKRVAAGSGRMISPQAPILGERIFYCETGLHLQGLQKDVATYEPFSPESVGARRKLSFGSKIGRKEVLDCLRGLKMPAAKFEIDEIARHVRRKAAEIGRPLEKAELRSLVNS
jgi:homocitrate synthase NifV